MNKTIKKIILITMVCVTGLSFMGCSTRHQCSENYNEIYDIKVQDVNEFEIKLNGEDLIELTVGDTYEEQGVTVNRKAEVKKETMLDTSIPGFYKITYTAEDEDGNIAVAERMVKVRKY